MQDVSKAIDKAAGVQRKVVGVKPGHGEFVGRTTRGHIDFKDGTEGFDRPWMHNDESRAKYHQATAPATEDAEKWNGWGTALKPAWEPIIVARKPLIGTVVDNVLKHGTGGLNIDRCRVEYLSKSDQASARPQGSATSKVGALAGGIQNERQRNEFVPDNTKGRWPANLIHDGSDEVLSTFPDAQGQIAPSIEDGAEQGNIIYAKMKRGGPHHFPRQESDKNAARFFYCAKASKSDRNEGMADPRRNSNTALRCDRSRIRQHCQQLADCQAHRPHALSLPSGHPSRRYRS